MRDNEKKCCAPMRFKIKFYLPIRWKIRKMIFKKVGIQSLTVIVNTCMIKIYKEIEFSGSIRKYVSENQLHDDK